MFPVRYYKIPQELFTYSPRRNLYDVLIDLGLPEGFKILERQTVAYDLTLFLLVEHNDFEYTFLPDKDTTKVPVYDITKVTNQDNGEPATHFIQWEKNAKR